jgi:hypothetical protein
MLITYLKPFMLKKIRKNCRKFSTITKAGNAPVSNSPIMTPDNLFKILFNSSGNHFQNYMYIIFIFFKVDFNLVPQSTTFLTKENAVGIELFFRLVFNPYFKVESQADFDKIKSLLNQKVVVFSTFYLLLTQVMSCTQGYTHIQGPQRQLPIENLSVENVNLNFFAVIKAGLVQQFSTLNEQFTFSQSSVSPDAIKKAKSYNPIYTFNKYLSLLEEANLFMLEKLLRSTLLFGAPFAYSHVCPEIFAFDIQRNKTNLPFSKETATNFISLYLGISELNCLIQKTFKQKNTEKKSVDKDKDTSTLNKKDNLDNASNI